jgi:hypothetical protein
MALLASAVCLLARTHPAHYSAHGHVQRRAYMRALGDVYMRDVAYAHSTFLTRSRSDTLVRTCRGAHAHAHSHTEGITHTDGISHRTHTQLPTYTNAHMNTHRHTKEQDRAHTYTQTRLCTCVPHTYAHTYLHTVA